MSSTSSVSLDVWTRCGAEIVGGGGAGSLFKRKFGVILGIVVRDAVEAWYVTLSMGIADHWQDSDISSKLKFPFKRSGEEQVAVNSYHAGLQPFPRRPCLEQCFGEEHYSGSSIYILHLASTLSHYSTLGRVVVGHGKRTRKGHSSFKLSKRDYVSYRLLQRRRHGAFFPPSDSTSFSVDRV